MVGTDFGKDIVDGAAEDCGFGGEVSMSLEGQLGRRTEVLTESPSGGYGDGRGHSWVC